MRKIYFIVIATFLGVCSFAQPVLKTLNYNYLPEMDSSSGGIWEIFHIDIEDDEVARKTDSTYITAVSWPDYGDLLVPDLELKVKSLWLNDSIFFLFQRLDDIYVNGYNSDNSMDETVEEGLENRDATTIYLFLKCDSLRLNSVFTYSNYTAWLRFGWKSNDVEGGLQSWDSLIIVDDTIVVDTIVVPGDTVKSYSDFHAESVQWCDDTYCYTKLGISLEELSPGLPDTIQASIDSIGVGFIGFAVDLSENDKEVGEPPYSIQTRAYWYKDMGETALDDIPVWGWLWFFRDTLQYVSPVKYIQNDVAAIFPNPADEYINIRLTDSESASYQVYDIMGRLLLTGNIYGRDNTLYISTIEAGTYFMRITNSTGLTSTQKFIKIDAW